MFVSFLKIKNKTTFFASFSLRFRIFADKFVFNSLTNKLKRMKKFTKFFLTALALTFSANIAAQDAQEVVYNSCGYDVNAKKMINFTWTAEGFKSADAPEAQNISALGYKRDSIFYTLSANGDQQTLTAMHAETFEQVSQVSGPQNAACGLPIQLYSTTQYPLGTFAIAAAKEEGVGTRFYTAVLDEQKAELKRVTTISYWYDDAAKTSIRPIAFFFSYANPYFVYVKRQGGEESLWLGQLNIMTGAITETGVIDVIKNVDPEKAVASIYPLGYTNYLVISPDGKENSSIYTLPTFAQNGVVNCQLQTKAKTVLASCYQRPSTVTGGMTGTPIAKIQDLKCEIDGTKITVTFTMPAADVKGNPLVADDWAASQDYSRQITANAYMEGSFITMAKPEGVNYFFPGDKVTLTGDLSTIYGVTNPNGLHCFTVATSPANGYTGKTMNYNSVFALVGGAKPEPVTNAKAEKSGANSATFSWTAPTATEYSDWGYEFDGSNLNYSIVRNVDGVVVAEGITECTAEVGNLAKEPGDYDFSVYAVANGTQSAAAATNAINCQPPTYDFLAYNNTTKTMVAFNLDEAFTHTDWMKNNDIQSEVGFVRGQKLYTASFNFNNNNPSYAYGWQTFVIFTAEKLERQGYNTSNYWYPNNGQIIRHLTTAAFDPVQDRAFGIAHDTVRNADQQAVALKYYVVDVDTVASYTLQNRIVAELGTWKLNDAQQNAKAVMAVAAFNKKFYAAVANRENGQVKYELCTFNPMTQQLDRIADIALDIDPSYGAQFMLATADKLYLGYNAPEKNTVLYEISTADGALTKVFEMDGQYTYAYQKPSVVAKPAKQIGPMTAPTITRDEETGTYSVELTLPTTYADGTAITDELRVRVLQDGVQLTLSPIVSPDTKVEITGLNVAEGLHLLTFITIEPFSPSTGTSCIATNVINGPAKPNAPTNVVAEMFGDNEAQVNWTAPTTSIWADWGATIAATDKLTYIVEVTQTGEVVSEEGLVDAEWYAEHIADYNGQYSFTVYAVNGTQKSAGAESNLVEVVGQLDPTAISAVSTDAATTVGIYNEAGVRTDRLQRGLNIVRRADGKTVKLIVK